MSSQLIVRIPEEQKNFLSYIAKKNDLSISDLVREAIQNYLFKTGSKQNVLLKLADIGEKKNINKTPKSISSQYKKYLYSSK